MHGIHGELKYVTVMRTKLYLIALQCSEGNHLGSDSQERNLYEKDMRGSILRAKSSKE